MAESLVVVSAVAVLLSLAALLVTKVGSRARRGPRLSMFAVGEYAPGRALLDQEPARNGRRQTHLVSLRTRPTVSVVVPTLNEAGSLAWVLERLPRWVDEVVLVDGLSTDETEVIARSVMA